MASPPSGTRDPHGGIGAFTPDNYPVVDLALPNAYLIMDSNHGFKMIGLGKLVANDILGGGESRLDGVQAVAIRTGSDARGLAFALPMELGSPQRPGSKEER